MTFLITTKRKTGISRDEIIDHLTSKMDPSTWDLIRTGKIKQVYYTMGDEPGFIAIVNSSNLAEVKALVTQATSKHNLFEIEIVPIDRFPDFPNKTRG